MYLAVASLSSSAVASLSSSAVASLSSSAVASLSSSAVASLSSSAVASLSSSAVASLCSSCRRRYDAAGYIPLKTRHQTRNTTNPQLLPQPVYGYYTADNLYNQSIAIALQTTSTTSLQPSRCRQPPHYRRTAGVPRAHRRRRNPIPQYHKYHQYHNTTTPQYHNTITPQYQFTADVPQAIAIQTTT